MECEVCGKGKIAYYAIIEGATLGVCRMCAKYSNAVKPIVEKQPPSASTKEEGIVELIDDYGKKIKEARERKGMNVEELAKKINEKVGYLERIEKERTTPDEKLIRKLERELGIKLRE